MTIEKVISNYYWALKQLIYLKSAFSKYEQTKVLNTLIDSANIKEVILARIS